MPRRLQQLSLDIFKSAPFHAKFHLRQRVEGEKELIQNSAVQASSISRIVTVTPGIFTIRVPGNFSFGISRAIIKFLITVLGEQIQISRSGETGKLLFSPFSGSRKIPEAKDDAAPVGFPGRTVT